MKIALEQLLGGTCHHMVEVFPRPDQMAAFTAAIDGEDVDWTEVLDDYSAVVDFPGAMFWSEISAAHPDALVLLSTRDPEAWYESASNTIFQSMSTGPPEVQAWMEALGRGLDARFSTQFDDKDRMIAVYEAHNARVRELVPPDRLIDWTPSDGWGPICEGLGLPVPDQPFPKTNTTAEFRAMVGLDPSPG